MWAKLMNVLTLIRWSKSDTKNRKIKTFDVTLYENQKGEKILNNILLFAYQTKLIKESTPQWISGWLIIIQEITTTLLLLPVDTS